MGQGRTNQLLGIGRHREVALASGGGEGLQNLRLAGSQLQGQSGIGMATYAGKQGNQGGSALGGKFFVSQLLTHHSGNVSAAASARCVSAAACAW